MALKRGRRKRPAAPPPGVSGEEPGAGSPAGREAAFHVRTALAAEDPPCCQNNVENISENVRPLLFHGIRAESSPLLGRGRGTGQGAREGGTRWRKGGHCGPVWARHCPCGRGVPCACASCPAHRLALFPALPCPPALGTGHQPAPEMAAKAGWGTADGNLAERAGSWTRLLIQTVTRANRSVTQARPPELGPAGPWPGRPWGPRRAWGRGSHRSSPKPGPPAAWRTPGDGHLREGGGSLPSRRLAVAPTGDGVRAGSGPFSCSVLGRRLGGASEALGDGRPAWPASSQPRVRAGHSASPVPS